MAGNAETTDSKDARTSRVTMLLVGLVLIGASIALGVWIYLHGDPPFALDVWWNALIVQSSSDFLLGLSYVMNWLGAGWFGVLVVPIVTGGILVAVGRPWSALYFVTASAASAGAVQIMKHTFGRARPEEIIVMTDVGSYPSGHVSNAATVAVALAVIFPRLWVALVAVAWVALMAFSRTYLHAHWLSDTVGGAALGAGVSLVLAAAFAAFMEREPLPQRGWIGAARRVPDRSLE